MAINTFKHFILKFTELNIAKDQNFKTLHVYLSWKKQLNFKRILNITCVDFFISRKK